MNYSEIEKLPADAYLNPEIFVTGFDSQFSIEQKREKYLRGLGLGKEFQVISISENGVWGANSPDTQAYLSSYEGIGYHSITSELLRGFLDSPAIIKVYRKDGTCTLILNKKVIQVVSR